MMGRILFLWVLIGCLLSVDMASAARGGGGRGGGGRAKIGGGLQRTVSKKLLITRRHNSASASYCDHKDALPVVIIAIGLLGGWAPFVGSCGALLCCMALSASEVYHLIADKLLQVYLERGLDSSGQVRSLRQSLADHIKSGLLEPGNVDMAQVHEWPIGNDTMKSKMEIDPTTQRDAGYYECQADNQYAIDRRGFRTDYIIYTY